MTIGQRADSVMYGWTRHGHPIESLFQIDTRRPPISRCGGPALCEQCAADAASAPPMSPPDTFTTTETTMDLIKPSVLSVHADVSDLLEHFGTEEALFEFLGKLKDLLA